MRRRGANGIACAGQVDVDSVVPVGIFPVEYRFESLNAGVGEQDVELAKGRDCLVRRGAQRGQIALI